MSGPFEDDLTKIGRALEASAAVLREFAPGRLQVEHKAAGDPVTEADRRVDDLLRQLLPAPGEGWLSEETADNRERLSCVRVWVVDPIDGTREFVAGIPEWCVSIGLVVDGLPVAGGICNPATDQWILGAEGSGVWLNGEAARASGRSDLAGARVLASRSELKRGEWERFGEAPFTVQPTGSVAYKLGLVAAGLADATWTLVPKHEWDVAAGVALVRAAGGIASRTDWRPQRFNQESPKIGGLIACGAGLRAPIRELLG